MSSPISATPTSSPSYAGTYPTNPPGNNPTLGNNTPGPQSTPTLPPIACDALHDLAKGLGALADGLDHLLPRSGDVLRGAQKKLDDLKFCPAPHVPDDPNDLPFDPGHRTSPELNSDEKMLLKQREQENHKHIMDMIRNIK